MEFKLNLLLNNKLQFIGGMIMKKKLLTILICGVMTIGITGCSNSKKEIKKEDLQSVNNKIIDYLESNGVTNYDNYVFNYVDEENNVVVVGLLDNSKEEQEKFKKSIVDSDLIKFVKSEKLVNENNDKDESKNTFNSSQKSCEYVRTYKFIDYYDYEGPTPEVYFIIVEQFQSNLPMMLGLNTTNFKKEFKKNQNYEITYRKRIDFTKKFLDEETEIIKIEPTDKEGMDQTQESCMLK